MSTTDDSIIDEILAYMASPEGVAETKRREQREARTPKIKVVVPEGLAEKFVAEFEVLALNHCPWIRGDEGPDAQELMRVLVKGREAALRLNAEACRAMYEEKTRMAYRDNLTGDELERLHVINVQTDGHPLSMNLDLKVLMLDPRLDGCGYDVAPWLRQHVADELQKWREEVGTPYGCSWVDAKIGRKP